MVELMLQGERIKINKSEEEIHKLLLQCGAVKKVDSKEEFGFTKASFDPLTVGIITFGVGSFILYNLPNLNSLEVFKSNLQ